MATGPSREPHQVPTINAMMATNAQTPAVRSDRGRMDAHVVNGRLVEQHAIQHSVIRAGTVVKAANMNAQQVLFAKLAQLNLKSAQ